MTKSFDWMTDAETEIAQTCFHYLPRECWSKVPTSLFSGIIEKHYSPYIAGRLAATENPPANSDN